MDYNGERGILSAIDPRHCTVSLHPPSRAAGEPRTSSLQRWGYPTPLCHARIFVIRSLAIDMTVSMVSNKSHICAVFNCIRTTWCWLQRERGRRWIVKAFKNEESRLKTRFGDTSDNGQCFEFHQLPDAGVRIEDLCVFDAALRSSGIKYTRKSKPTIIVPLGAQISKQHR